ncbi:MAG: ribonuclease HII [Deltaproteobacteria bacterium]
MTKDGLEYLNKERERIESLKVYEYEAYREGYQFIAGIDEVGRGPLAGPVVAAAVILPPGFFLPEVNDSKKLTSKVRSQLSDAIKGESVAWALAAVYPPYLDRINILNATREAMRTAVEHLTPSPDFLLIDAVKLHDIDIKQRSIIKGDSNSVSIACASILAKVERDRSMEAFDKLYPDYGFARHKGYGTREHLEALMRRGVCPIHRESYAPVRAIREGGNYGYQPGLFDQDNA